MTADLDTLRARAATHGQSHIFDWWGDLDERARERLLAQIDAIDFALLDRLVRELIVEGGDEEMGELTPATPIPVPSTDAERDAQREASAIGTEAIEHGKVAALVVAGGQGTRLGYDGPKGTFPAAPITGKSLFQLHAERILATRKRYEARVPWYIMTSEANDAETRRYFGEHDWFGLPPEDIVLFRQASVPVVTPEGKLLLEAKDRIATSPNGHGGTLSALRDSSILGDMQARGIEVVSYFQVDNALVHCVDPVFIGHHVQTGSRFSSKALPKRDPEEGLGVFAWRDGEMVVVEYSDLPAELKTQTNPEGALVYSAGSIAIHALDVDFIDRLTESGDALPYHRADKKVPCIDADGYAMKPKTPNGVKFELFIFDAISFAENPLVLMVERREEFAPIKNAEGPDSPETARRAQIERFARWLHQAEVTFPRDEHGRPTVAVEISPLFALDADELRQRLSPGTTFDGDVNLQA